MHSVEKIGGTSMSSFADVLNNIFLTEHPQHGLYQRIFVVSAYSGMTNRLLEHKKTGEPGVYQRFAETSGAEAWLEALEQVREQMLDKNAEIFSDNQHALEQANSFIGGRIDDCASVMNSLHQLCHYGQFQLAEHLIKVREMLASLGEAHSAFNTALALKLRGINARFVDLTGWQAKQQLPFAQTIAEHFQDMDIGKELLIAPGYTQCSEGLMNTFDRGYTEITFAQIAAATGAKEAIIHKEFHLSTADPNLVGQDKVVTIGMTNYDVADQLSNLGMEAIHPRAGRTLRRAGVELRIKNAFEPEHAGTLICQSYSSETPRVEIIAGRKDVFGIEVFDQEMLGDPDYDTQISSIIKQLRIYIDRKSVV